jgi:hypothetical protein
MKLIDPDDKKAYHHFSQQWSGYYTSKNPVEPPTISALRVLFQYGTFGSIPDGFILAILENDLYRAYSTASMEDLTRIHGTTQYMMMALPLEAWGSPEKVQKWIEKMKKSKMFRPTDKY